MEEDIIELGHLQPVNNNDDKEKDFKDTEVTSGNGGQKTFSTADESVNLPLLSVKVTESNGNYPAVESVQEAETEKCTTFKRIKDQLDELVYRKVRLWMVLAAIFVVILIVIGISVLFCSVIHEDVDDKYDAASFIVPRCFNGSFQLTNQEFPAEHLSPSNQSQSQWELETKISDIFRSSPALGRYFSQAQIYPLSNSSVLPRYRLLFKMPVDHADLERFVLSREMVYNVFRQNLYDQETTPQRLFSVEPDSLQMREEYC